VIRRKQRQREGRMKEGEKMDIGGMREDVTVEHGLV